MEERTETPKTINTTEHKNYEAFAEMFPKIVNGEYNYLKLESDGFEPLSVEHIGDDQVSIMHTYVQEGDLMYDPMINFKINTEDRTLTPMAYQQSMPPLYQEFDEKNNTWLSVDGNGRQTQNPNIGKNITKFASEWFSNIEQQNFRPVRAIMEINGEDIRVTFDKDGNPIVPESASESNTNNVNGNNDINAKDEIGFTLLMSTARDSENPETILSLIQAGADVNTKNENGVTPLMYACRYNRNTEAISLLLDAGANVNAKTENGMTALMFAASANLTPEIAVKLLAAGADVNAKNEWGCTPLIYAALDNSNPEITKTLLVAGADANAQDVDGTTSLMIAAANPDKAEIIDILLENGADPRIKDKREKTALDYAQKNDRIDNSKIIKKLESAINIKLEETGKPQSPAKSILDEINWPKPKNKSEEMRQDFTKKIIKLMEDGNAFWQKPWNFPTEGLPRNGVTGQRYNGVNIAYLMVAADKNGYTDPRWMTFKQAQDKGYHIKEGEHGTKIEFFSKVNQSKTKNGAEAISKKLEEIMDKGSSDEDIEKTMSPGGYKYPMIKIYTVFNAAQIEGIEPLHPDTPEEEKEFRYHERAESIMENCGVSITYGSSEAFYSPKQDIIRMPDREWFSTPEHFYATALHEIAHSTGHESRMNRETITDPSVSFGSKDYAMEELYAEMASAFVFQEIRMPLSEQDMKEHTEQQAGYTKRWLNTLKDDYKIFYQATRNAAKIADYTLTYDHTQEKDKTIGASRPNVATQTAQTTPTPEDKKEDSASSKYSEPLKIAKSLLGQDTSVTEAQPGYSYTGDVIRIGRYYAIQKVDENKAVIHNLSKISEDDFTTLTDLPKDARRVAITYTADNSTSLKAIDRSKDRNRESLNTR
ncbi:hypothetical protein FACS1894187_02460 [Synergistales bacterium]|nr:hypothetical protein FACS1894187_02460 [Synergistales bacterium]